MLVTETCCCMSGTMTGGKSREWRKMNSVASAMTSQNRTPISLHGCMTVAVIHLWQNSPRRTVTALCRTIWGHLYRLLTAREMWSGTASLTSMGMYWNSEENETSYPSVSKVNTKMGKQDCITTGSGITRHIPETTLVKTR